GRWLWGFGLVVEQQGVVTVGEKFAVERRRSLEMSCPYLEAALARPPRGLCAARRRLLLEPLVRILRHAAVRDTVGGLVRDHVHSREAQSFCRAQDGGGVVRIEQAVENDGDALETRLDHGLDPSLALRGE